MKTIFAYAIATGIAAAVHLQASLDAFAAAENDPTLV